MAPEDNDPVLDWPDADPFSLAVGDAELTSSSARGALPAAPDSPAGDPRPDPKGAVPTDEDLADVPVEWDLSYDPDPYSFTPLRSRRLTDLLAATVGTGKHWSANEAVRVDGRVRVGDRTVEFDAAPGHQGHTLGSSPPDAWTWVQCNGFPGDSVSLEALDIEGPLSLCLRRDGEVHALNRLEHVVGPRANETERDEPGYWRFRGAGEGVELRATVEADDDHWQRASYLTPDGSLRYNAHCSVSQVTLTYRVDGDRARTLSSSAGRAEWVETGPPVPGEYRPRWE